MKLVKKAGKTKLIISRKDFIRIGMKLNKKAQDNNEEEYFDTSYNGEYDKDYDGLVNFDDQTIQDHNKQIGNITSSIKYIIKHVNNYLANFNDESYEKDIIRNATDIFWDGEEEFLELTEYVVMELKKFYTAFSNCYMSPDASTDSNISNKTKFENIYNRFSRFKTNQKIYSKNPIIKNAVDDLGEADAYAEADDYIYGPPDRF